MKNKNLFPGLGLADPHALVEGDRVYLFCGHDKSPKTEDTWRMDKWMILSSDDLVSWRIDGEILPTQTYIGDKDHCWAGYIMKKNDKFYWFFSNKNIDTGVLVSDGITGEFVDILKKPLIPKGITDVNSYDPCVYTDNTTGVSTIFFGVGHYYCADLSEDLLSLAEPPQRIYVYDKNGEDLRTSDKSTVFRHGEWYYLAYGDRYARSKNLKGPYEFMGKFHGGGHNDIFEFQGKLWVCNEFHDTNIFFRGVRVLPLEFTKDGEVILPDGDEGDLAPKKTWDFSKTAMHWFLNDYSDCVHQDNYISLEGGTALRSPLLPGVILEEDKKLRVEISCVGVETPIEVEIILVHQDGIYWDQNAKEVVLKETIYPTFAKETYMISIPLPDHAPMILKKINIIPDAKSNGCYQVYKVSIDS